MANLETVLKPAECRVLGVLLEKQVLTPDVYPLSLNYLTTACNQKTSRDPVMNLSEAEVSEAILGLRKAGLAVEMKTSESRVLKYSHSISKLAALNAKEQAALALLLLRGPQTAGEIRGRSERMAEFASIEDAESVLKALSEKSCGAMAGIQARRPGTKEQRWAHLMGGAVALEAPEEGGPRSGGSGLEARVAALEAEVAALKEKLEGKD